MKRMVDRFDDVMWDVEGQLKTLGFEATVEGGGASIPFIQIKLSDGCFALIGTASGTTWGGQIYGNEDAMERADFNDEYIELDVPINETDAAVIVRAFSVWATQRGQQ